MEREIKERVAERLRKGKRTIEKCLVGFDGFTDEILKVVDKRSSPSCFVPLKTIALLGTRIAEAAGKSTNIELVLIKKKIGGNGPILASALIEGGQAVTLIGAIGEKGHIEPLFQPLAKRCSSVFPIAPSGHSDALEFEDGKIIFGKHSSIIHICYETLLEKIGKEKLIELFEESRLIASTNWTMLPYMNEIWTKIGEEITPHLSQKNRFFFVDLADPAKRSDEDLALGLKALQKLAKTFDLILGLNLAEAERVGKLLCNFSKTSTKKETEELGARIKKATGFSQILIHSKRFAAAFWEEKALFLDTLFTDKPLMTTGAGDNFNGGYCNGLLLGMPVEESLAVAIGTSGFYVRHGKSPQMKELADFFLTKE